MPPAIFLKLSKNLAVKSDKNQRGVLPAKIEEPVG
jgi:hypothetical protein